MSKKNDTRLFHDLEMPRELFPRVLVRVATLRRRTARLRFAFHGFVAASFAVVFAPVLSYAAHEFYASGFYDYASLLFSDTAFAWAHANDLALSLVESLPSLPLLLIASCLGPLAYALYRMRLEAHVAFLSPSSV